MVKLRKNFGKTKWNIIQLEKTHPEIRKDNTTLLYYYWKVFDGIQSPDDIPELTPAETVTRCFRKVVEEGWITLTDEEKIARGKANEVYKKEFGVQTSLEDFGI
jgi:hypothetical protein